MSYPINIFSEMFINQLLFYQVLQLFFHRTELGMEQSNMTILNSNIPIHPSNMNHPKRKSNRHSHGNLQSERLTLGDEAKIVSNQKLT